MHSGDDLRSWRLSLGLSQQDIAELAQVKQVTVSRWEKGKRPVPDGVLSLLRDIEKRRKSCEDVKASCIINDIEGSREDMPHYPPGGLMLEILHTAAEGTLLRGTSRGDGTAVVLKSHGWRWGRSIACWYVPFSRDRLPKRRVIESTAQALRDAGFEVSVSIDEALRSAAEVEASKLAREELRQSKLQARAEAAQRSCDAAWGRADAARNCLPEWGEPIKVGHHSERGHRAALERAWSSLGAAVEMESVKAEALRRAEAAARSADARYDVVTVGNRISKLQAEIRAIHRKIAGSQRTLGVDSEGRKIVESISAASGAYRGRLEQALQQAEDSLKFWQEVRKQQIESGKALDLKREDLSVGDRVFVKQLGWFDVVRVNPTGVTVQNPGSFQLRYKFHEILRHEKKKS